MDLTEKLQFVGFGNSQWFSESGSYEVAYEGVHRKAENTSIDACSSPSTTSLVDAAIF